MILTDRETVQRLIPARDPAGHKGTFGKVYCLCGSPAMFGAAILSASASLRSGTGLCTIGGAEDLCNRVISARPELVGHVFAPDAVDPRDLSEKMNQSTAAVIGSGLGKEAWRLVRKIVPFLDIPMVLDADGIRALCEEGFDWAKIKAPFVVTPHPGEMSALCGLPVKEIERDRIGCAVKTAQRIGGTVLLKGQGTIVTDGTTVYKNTTGNDGMATPGSGDVLGGLIGGLIAQGASPFCAAVAGAYLHGLAGDLAEEEKTHYGLIASDLVDYLPGAFRKVLSK